jgi:hypothetical protein
MKKIIYIASALALVSAAPAFAANPHGIAVSGSAAAQCAVSGATTATVSTDLADANGFARTNIGADVAAALTALNINAWCTGNSNSVVISRTAFVKTGGAAGGVVDTSGFANGVVYDISLSIPGGIRSDEPLLLGANLDGTSDGAGNGPGAGIGAGLTVDSFGPTGTGVVLGFANQGSSTSGAITTAGADGATSAFNASNANRLSAGSYVSNVTITLGPNV